MRKVIVRCGCSALVETKEYDDEQPGLTMQEVAGECETCVSNGGRYDRSPHWIDNEPLQLQKLSDLQQKYPSKRQK